jgi:hypothetical protein
MKRGGETHVVLQARPKGLKCLAVNVGREQEGGTSVEPKSWTRPQVTVSDNPITYLQMSLQSCLDSSVTT